MRINDLFRNPFYRQCWQMLALLLGVIMACKLSKGMLCPALVAVGIQSAFARRPANAFICFALLSFMSVLNPVAFRVGGLLRPCVHLGMPVMALAMLSAASARKGRQALPLAGLWLYALVACGSSIGGYAPFISFMKILNFVFFVLGIYAGMRNLDQKPQELQKLRAFIFAFSVFIVAGSLALNVVSPFAAHASTASWMGGDFAAANEAIREKIAATGDAGFLCGVVNHSQCLGPTAACVGGWALLDMLLIEKRFMLGHLLTLILCPYVLFLTKSRTALLAFLAVIMMVVAYAVPKFRVPAHLKRRIVTMMVGMLIAFAVGAVVLEATSGGVSKWLVKHDSQGSGEFTFESLTATRRGKIETSLYDFRQSPFLGMGFQVEYWHQFMGNKFVLSAPIEKGFLPTMILGETGVLGAIVFLVFLISFYAVCTRRGFFATLTLFTAYLASNLGEATFFSPGGTGGPEWLITLAGGFVIDLTTIAQRRGQPGANAVVRRLPLPQPNSNLPSAKRPQGRLRKASRGGKA